jgi:hypothetical protein
MLSTWRWSLTLGRLAALAVTRLASGVTCSLKAWSANRFDQYEKELAETASLAQKRAIDNPLSRNLFNLCSHSPNFFESKRRFMNLLSRVRQSKRENRLTQETYTQNFTRAAEKIHGDDERLR